MAVMWSDMIVKKKKSMEIGGALKGEHVNRFLKTFVLKCHKSCIASSLNFLSVFLTQPMYDTFEYFYVHNCVQPYDFFFL